VSPAISTRPAAPVDLAADTADVEDAPEEPDEPVLDAFAALPDETAAMSVAALDPDFDTTVDMEAAPTTAVPDMGADILLADFDCLLPVPEEAEELVVEPDDEPVEE